jgi:spermidine/putrescine transport system permease protein
VAFSVTLLSTLLGTCAAFLFEQEEFRFKNAMYFLMLAPMVIPGVILGISILMFTNTLGLFFEKTVGWDVGLFGPGYWLVVLGQVSFISTFVALVVIARLRKFDRTLEEAAMSLGAGRMAAIWFVTLRYLRPALIGSAAVAFLMSFENFNTTLFFVGSESTIPITLYLQVRDGSTPVINAISFVLILTSSVMALANVFVARRET